MLTPLTTIIRDKYNQHLKTTGCAPTHLLLHPKTRKELLSSLTIVSAIGLLGEGGYYMGLRMICSVDVPEDTVEVAYVHA